MSFSKDERISLSKSIIEIPDQISNLDKNLSIISISQQDLLNKDNFTKGLAEKKTVLIDFYQKELKYINGRDSVSVTETDIQNSAQKKPANIFFPADQSFPTPSCPDGVWKNFVPLVLSGAIGKGRLETYGTAANYEMQDMPIALTAIDNFVTTYTLLLRTTGQGCVVGIPPNPDVISSDPAVTAALNDIITKVNTVKTILQSERSEILLNTDTDLTRSSETNANKLSIEAAISAIDAWLAYPNFNTAHGKTTCVDFFAYNPSLLAPTKGYDTQIQALKNALLLRKSYYPTRESQILSYLGAVTQNTGTGELTATSGMYGDRAKLFDLRLNLIGGSLAIYQASLKSSNAIVQQKNALLNKQDVYNSFLKTTKLKAPSNGTSFLHVVSSTGYSVGQTIYLMANTQQEIELTIEQISGTMIKVSKNIPPTYRPSDGARIYLDLS